MSECLDINQEILELFFLKMLHRDYISFAHLLILFGDLCSYNVFILFGKLTNDKIKDKSSAVALGGPDCCQGHPVLVEV